MEIWESIIYRGKLLEVSNYGKVKTENGKKNRKTQLNSGGYECFTMDKMYLIHRIVASAFVDNPSDKKEVNHKDGNKLNNHWTNLEWVNRSENNYHAIRVLGHKRNTDGLRIANENGLNRKPVAIFSKSGELVNSFISSRECAKYLNVGTSAVSMCLMGNNKTCKGYEVRFILKHSDVNQ